MVNVAHVNRAANMQLNQPADTFIGGAVGIRLAGADIIIWVAAVCIPKLWIK
jgi:hypothetical protein